MRLTSSVAAIAALVAAGSCGQRHASGPPMVAGAGPAVPTPAAALDPARDCPAEADGLAFVVSGGYPLDGTWLVDHTLREAEVAALLPDDLDTHLLAPEEAKAHGASTDGNQSVWLLRTHEPPCQARLDEYVVARADAAVPWVSILRRVDGCELDLGDATYAAFAPAAQCRLARPVPVAFHQPHSPDPQAALPAELSAKLPAACDAPACERWWWLVELRLAGAQAPHAYDGAVADVRVEPGAPECGSPYVVHHQRWWRRGDGALVAWPANSGSLDAALVDEAGVRLLLTSDYATTRAYRVAAGAITPAGEIAWGRSWRDADADALNPYCQPEE